MFEAGRKFRSILLKQNLSRIKRDTSTAISAGATGFRRMSVILPRRSASVLVGFAVFSLASVATGEGDAAGVTDGLADGVGDGDGTTDGDATGVGAVLRSRCALLMPATGTIAARKIAKNTRIVTLVRFIFTNALND